MGRVSSLAFLLGLTAVFAFAQGEALRPARVTPDELRWTRDPRGYDQANVIGDPTRAGIYAARVKFAPGLRIPPHFHPDDRVVTVLSGTVHFGYGEQFDEARMMAMPAGSVWTEPAGQSHVAWAKNGEVIVQVIGHGPSGTTPIPN